MTANLITTDRLREVLNYDPTTGAFTWLVRTSSRIHVGDIAGRADPLGYRKIRVDGREYLAHRLAFLFMTGDWPADEIDHRDGEPSNNAWTNLREATRSQNTANTRLRKNKTLPKGVSFRASSGRYIAQIVIHRETKYLGSFATPEDAHRAYLHAARLFHGDFMRAA